MRPRQQHIAGAVIVMALGVAVGACGSSAPSKSSTPDSAAAPLTALAASVADDLGTASDSVMRKLGFGPATPDVARTTAGAASEAPATPAAPVAARRRIPKPKPAAVEPAPLAIEAPPVAAEEPVADNASAVEPVVDEPVEVAAAIEELPVVLDETIYTVADPDVAPPVMRSSDLPQWRPSDGPASDAVEVTVSRDGGVEHIRLVSQPRRMIDMMALSAAKLWKFEPATKDGAPVRYRLVLASPRTINAR
jgi:TonB family protein